MKLNKECIRDVLLYDEEHCIFEDNKLGKHRLHEVSFHELCNAENLSQYTADDIRYTLSKLFEGRYIQGYVIPKDAYVTFSIANVVGLTLRGHDLLDNIRPEPVWDKTKGVLQKVGDFSLGIMSQVAGEVMTAYTKKMMGLE